MLDEIIYDLSMETTMEILKMSDVQAYDIPSFVLAYKISRAQVYKEINAGRLRIFKVGRRTLISREAADTWRRSLEAAVAE